VTLVNEDAVKFLGGCEADGTKLENCPLHVRKWIDELKDSAGDGSAKDVTVEQEGVR